MEPASSSSRAPVERQSSYMRRRGLLALLGLRAAHSWGLVTHRAIHPGFTRHKRCGTQLDSPSSRAPLHVPRTQTAAAASDLAFDVTRERIKLEGLSSYGVVTALIMNAALRLLSTVDLGADARGTLFEKVVQSLFVACIVVSVLAGIHTTVVFTLVSIYAKTALGRNLDSGYVDFLVLTSPLRAQGFKSFITALGSFSISFPLAVFLKMRGRAGWIALCSCTVAALGMIRVWLKIIRLASEHIFRTALIK